MQPVRIVPGRAEQLPGDFDADADEQSQCGAADESYELAG
jgi:hypothetical protein